MISGPYVPAYVEVDEKLFNQKMHAFVRTVEREHKALDDKYESLSDIFKTQARAIIDSLNFLTPLFKDVGEVDILKAANEVNRRFRLDQHGGVPSFNVRLTIEEAVNFGIYTHRHFIDKKIITEDFAERRNLTERTHIVIGEFIGAVALHGRALYHCGPEYGPLLKGWYYNVEESKVQNSPSTIVGFPPKPRLK